METESKSGNWTLKIAIAIIVIGFIIAFFQGCFDKNTETVIVTHPAVSGSTSIVKPDSKPITVHDTIWQNNPFGLNLSKAEAARWKAESQRVLKEYDELLLAYQNYNDSTEQAKPKEPIQPSEFYHQWDNDTITATVFGMNTGEIHSMQLKYTIKPQTTAVKVPQTVFRLLGGIETGMTKDLSKFNAKANIGFQNKKGNILTISADSDQRFYIGYTASIFSIKR